MNYPDLERRGEHIMVASSSKLPLPVYDGSGETIDELPVCSRVGDQYQVEIPNLVTEAGRVQLVSNPLDAGAMLGFKYPIGIGLAIPVTWIHHPSPSIGERQDELCGSKICSFEIESKVSIISENGVGNSYHDDSPSQISACKEEFADGQTNQGNFMGSTSQECTTLRDKMTTGSLASLIRKAKGNIALPGSPTSPWTDGERQSFLLGLYIFGKNLVQVRKFVEQKTMADILPYYYGKFYRSDAYRRWSECRKIRSRRCIFGQRIFTGWRQQELLSRLLPEISKEFHVSLSETFKTFNEGSASFEEFIFTLKSTVGIEGLVKAIGIGKGKHDLTGTVMDPARTNQNISVHPEIPIGKACSLLTSADIIKFLTGDFRLSKARSNDIFWEAVWPRLLAKGWHSEQPKDISSVGSRHALVFLIPGIRNFSRKKLVKGNHYFDSITDVLSKVASEPSLLVLDAEEVKGTGVNRGENGWATDTKLGQNDGLSDHQNQCYLLPRLPNDNSVIMKFTVMDTSLLQGGLCKARELTLPADFFGIYEPSSLSKKEQPYSNDSSEDDQVGSDLGTSDDKNHKESTGYMSSYKMASDAVKYIDTIPSTMKPINSHVSNDLSLDALNSEDMSNDTKCHFSYGKSGEQVYFAPVAKRRRLTACKYEVTGRRTSCFTKAHQLKKEGIQHELDSSKENEMHTEDGLFQTETSANPSIKNSLYEKNKDIGERSCCIVGATNPKVPKKKLQPQTLIDLNLPHEPIDYDTSESSLIALPGQLAGPDINKPSPASETKLLQDSLQARETYDQQSSLNFRRQGTRNRPPTIKALEAVACGLLGTKRRGRDTSAPTSCRLSNRPSRRVRRSVEISMPVPSVSTGRISPEVRDSGAMTNECHQSNTQNGISDSHAQPNKEGVHELLGMP